jgi:hypothetical protein
LVLLPQLRQRNNVGNASLVIAAMSRGAEAKSHKQEGFWRSNRSTKINAQLLLLWVGSSSSRDPTIVSQSLVLGLAKGSTQPTTFDIFSSVRED